eukprot:TRINITY_DN1799_c0_g1_i16.p1 TRINITY_DN1799_c0_g1~~TRINITY_DN1799_c0_g1_i16.p1  ORF type:complete len:349 (-),score=126.77 TRINITY_DN1799_c0_g1_i16:112-1158(-)
MIEIDKAFGLFAKAVNQCYEGQYPGLCRYPQFSFSRAMTIMWKQKVYSKTKSNLMDAFTLLLQVRRQNEIKAGKLMTKNNPISSFLISPKNSLLTELQNSEPEIMAELFGNVNKDIDLLFKFAHSVADLSVNELTIHFLGSTKSTVEEPYKELEKAILKQTGNFYQKAGEVIEIKYCKQILDEDYEAMGQIVLPSTLKKIGQLKQSYMEKYLRYYLQRRLSQYVNSRRKAEAIITREEGEKYLYRYIKELTSSKALTEKVAKGFYRHFTSGEEFVAELYEQVMAARNEDECARDVEIEYVNRRRKVPLELLPEERLVYAYSQSVTVKQLEAIRSKYESQLNIETDPGP